MYDVQLHTVAIDLGIKGSPSPFGAIVHYKNIGVSELLGNPLPHLENPFTQQRETQFKYQAFEGAIVFEVRRSKLASIRRGIDGEIQ